ncbi:molybdopterin-guanine dinucleotide biosynthesis protein B [Paenibacillus turicensis]|jgi:molybdopterin-guanine dinucleotide biosynthesis protein B|uniref:molybdopterin-guanine dinucleotide biosynthesis protein B n=1 Tax=Paenibacillus turicensis TaxID=160487 RepID=UPI003D27D615
MADLKVLQVVGYKNSGKTTLLAAWTELLSQQGKNVAVIKHHGHGGALELPQQKVDSVVMLESGAISSLAYGDGCIQLHMQQQEVDLTQLIEMVQWSKPDIIFIEGYKQAEYPKVVLLRQQEDWNSLSQLSKIVGVVVPINTELDIDVDMKIELANHTVIQREDIKATQQWLQKWMDGETDEDV